MSVRLSDVFLDGDEGAAGSKYRQRSNIGKE